MTALHIALGVALVAVNLAAGLLGAWRWHRDEYSHAFWPLLRAGQALVVIEVLQGGVLLLLGEELPRLHLIYGLVPLGVAFIAEQLRLTSAQTVLDQRGVGLGARARTRTSARTPRLTSSVARWASWRPPHWSSRPSDSGLEGCCNAAIVTLYRRVTSGAINPP